MASSELDFFNSLAGELEIKLSVPAEPVANLSNLRAVPEARVVTLNLRAEVYIREANEFRDLTPEELDGVAFRDKHIKLRGESGQVVEHDAPNGAYFTVRDLLQAVEETERRTRDRTEWLGGVDVHHCYFEGIHRNDDGVWDIYWGS